MLVEVLSSPIWQTIGVFLTIGMIIAAIIFFFLSQRSAKEKAFIAAIIFVVTTLVIIVSGVGVYAFSSTWSSNHTSTQPTQVPSPLSSAQPTPITLTIFKLASSYIGTGHNTTSNKTQTGSLVLSSIIEDPRGNISGRTEWGSPLCGSGPFTGKVSADNFISFTSKTNDGSNCEAIVNFTGTVNTQNNSIIGNYSTNSQTGTWYYSPT